MAQLNRVVERDSEFDADLETLIPPPGDGVPDAKVMSTGPGRDAVTMT